MKQKRIAAAVVMVCMVLLALPLEEPFPYKAAEEAENSIIMTARGLPSIPASMPGKTGQQHAHRGEAVYGGRMKKLEPLINELDRAIKVPKTPPTGIWGGRPRPTCVWETPPRHFLRELEKTQLSGSRQKVPPAS